MKQETNLSIKPPKGIVPMPSDPGYDKMIGANGENIIPPERRVLILKRPLYGLRSSPELYSSTARRILEDDGYVPSTADPCVFIKKLVNADGSKKMVTTRRPIYKQSAASATKDWTRGTSLRTAQADATPEYVEVEEQDEHIVMIYVDDIYAISPLGGATLSRDIVCETRFQS